MLMAISKPVQFKTIADYDALLAQHPDKLYELIDGEIVEKVPTEEHSLIAGNIYAELRAFIKPRELGRVAFEVRRQLPNDAHNARLPDVEFTRAERLLPVVRDGAVPQMPDLVVEIKSPSDTYISLREKAIYYLKNGTSIVWWVYPAKQQVEIHTADSISTLEIDEALDGGELLPDFKLALSAIFAE